MAGDAVLTLRVEAALRKRLDRLSKATRRTRSFLAIEVIRE